MRIAIVSDTHEPAVNGVVRAIDTSRQALGQMGDDVVLFAPGTRRMRRDEPPGTHRFPAIETRIYPGLHVSVLPILPNHLRGFDVVHVHTPGPLGLAALVAARRAGVPALYTYHTRFDDAIAHMARSQTAERLLTRAAERVERFIASRAAAVLAPTPSIASELESRLGVRAVVMPSGVDLDRFRPLARGPQPPVFLHLGRLAPEKNIAAVLDAFRHVLDARPDARLRMAGSGPDEARLRQRAWELGLDGAVEWLGFVPEAELARVYGEADVYVTASRFETQGLTTLEAFACGLPGALADVPVFRPLVDAGAALAADPEDARAFAAAMLGAYDGRPRLADAALRFARAHGTRAPEFPAASESPGAAVVFDGKWDDVPEPSLP